MYRYELIWVKDFYPRSPCGERLDKCCKLGRNNRISIHALLAESDIEPVQTKPRRKKFLSTLSLRRATFLHCTTYLNCSHFYPRSPCGERPIVLLIPPTRKLISIHALLAESDAIYPSSTPPKEYFYPRSPCGERPLQS